MADLYRGMPADSTLDRNDVPETDATDAVHPDRRDAADKTHLKTWRCG